MKKSNTHTIDFLFPVALFFVFSATALLVILLAANIYQNIVTTSNNNFEQSTTLSYITEKIRQNDSNGSSQIYLDHFDDSDALVIRQEIDDSFYLTYIYESEGELKELFIKEGVSATAETGTSIMEIHDLKMAEISENLYQFTCISSDGSSSSTMISVHSEEQ